MTKLKLMATLAAVIVSACASDRVDFGGVMSPSERPPERVACDQADWSPVERAMPEYPNELMTFLYLNQTRRDLRELTFSFDINAAGETRNIRFEAPRSFLEHRATQSAILAGAEALADWRYEWNGPGAPGYAEGCRQHFAFDASIPQN